MSSKKNKKGNISGGSRLFSASPSPSPSPSPGTGTGTGTGAANARGRSGTPFSDDDESASAHTPNRRQPAGAHSEDDHLARSQETTWHRRARDLCREHLRTLRAWEMVVREDLAKAVAAVCTSSGSLDDALKLSPSSLIKHSSIASALEDLHSDVQDLQLLLPRLSKLSHKLRQTSFSAQRILTEALDAKGVEFVSAPQWNTWSLDDIVGAVQAQVSVHILQSVHLNMLSQLLIRRGCVAGFASASPDAGVGSAPAPSLHSVEGKGIKDEGQSSSSSASEHSDSDAASRSSSASSRSHTASESESSNNSQASNDASGSRPASRSSSRARSTPSSRASTRTRVLEEWQALRHLRPFAAPSSSSLDRQSLEEICRVEIGRWDVER